MEAKNKKDIASVSIKSEKQPKKASSKDENVVTQEAVTLKEEAKEATKQEAVIVESGVPESTTVIKGKRMRNKKKGGQELPLPAGKPVEPEQETEQKKDAAVV